MRSYNPSKFRRRELAHLVKAESPEVRTQMQVIYADKNWNTTVYGVSTEFTGGSRGRRTP